ncbi:hypothetical protein R1sor_024573 [Riccia sorocarpa]|uniref:Reverse transcriptase zinc-binding domain-containing protein n=1 Tax=Riccia sorocarpa TaxID=122646 RepID=A0ABD3GQW0_9MARC
MYDGVKAFGISIAWLVRNPGKQSERQKTWIWRLLRRGFFTESRAEKMRLSDGGCSRCQGQRETFEHLFWGCSKVSRRWRALETAAIRVGLLSHHSDTLLELVDNAISSQDLHPGWFAVVTTGTQHLLGREISKLKDMFRPADIWTYLSSDEDDEDPGAAATDVQAEAEGDMASQFSSEEEGAI